MTEPKDVIVRIQDARDIHGGCIEGWKLFVSSHGFDFKDVVRNGLTAQQLINTGDIMAIELANIMVRKANRDG